MKSPVGNLIAIQTREFRGHVNLGDIHKTTPKASI